MNTYIERGYARKLMCHEVECLSPHTWYIPHHGVTHPNKAKLRIVFDAAAKSNGVSLNDNLMTGPDLLNSLFGVLQRFRLGSTALMADIEGMFHQVRVPKEDSDALRFLWKEAPKQPGAPDVYAMTVHIFGAADSPCCASTAWRSLVPPLLPSAGEKHPVLPPGLEGHQLPWPGNRPEYGLTCGSPLPPVTCLRPVSGSVPSWTGCSSSDAQTLPYPAVWQEGASVFVLLELHASNYGLDRHQVELGLGRRVPVVAQVTSGLSWPTVVDGCCTR